MNRSFTRSAWNNLNRQEQRVAAANMEVVSVLAKLMGATINIVGTLQGLYDVMESIMQSERTNTGDNSAVKASRQDSGGSKHYDYSKPFSEQVEDWTNGLIPKRDTLVLGRTPLVFRQVGLSDIPMTMDQTHLDYAVNGTKNPDHYWGKEGIKQLPELLKNPIAIIESATHPDNSIVAIVDAKVNGKDAMAAVRISNQGKINGHPIDANHMVNTQGRGNTISKLLADAIKKEDAKQIGVFYIDKEKGLSILKRAGL